MATSMQTQAVPEGVSESIRHLQAGREERGLRTLLLWPDRAVPALERSFGDLLAEVQGRHSPEPVEESVLRFTEGLCAYRAGRSEDARAAFTVCLEAIERIEAESIRWALRCATHWSLALALRRCGHLDKAVRLAREGAREAREREAFWLEGAARLAQGRVLRYVAGENARARACFDEAHRLLSAAHPPDPLGVAYVRAHEARLALDAGDAFLALSLLREARSGFGRSRHHRALSHSRIDQGWAHLQVRSVGIARECGEEALLRLREMGDERGVLRAGQLLAQAAFDQGRIEEAERRFEEVAAGAASLGDRTLHAEALVGMAQAHFADGHPRAVSRALHEAGELLASLPPWVATLQWQALNIAHQVRRRQLAGVPEAIRRLRAGLRQRGMPRLTAECLALCGFELARQGYLREAAPVLKEALSAAPKPDAVGWTERFLSTVSEVDVRQWIASLVTEMHEHAHLAEQHEALRICAIAALHDVKNLALSAYSALEVSTLETGQAPDAVISAKDTAFRAARLAADTELDIAAGRTQIRLTLKPIDLRSFLAVQQSIVDRSPNLGRCTLDAEPDLPPVPVDDRYLTRVFGNLISNAEKYATGSDIVLSVRVHWLSRRREVIVGFRDNGQGIHPEDAEILFNAFKDPSAYRQKRSDRGTGFGLHYCKLVVEAHGGRIWVDPRPGQGAAFYFSLPAPTG